MNLTCVLTDLYKSRLTHVHCLLALISKYSVLHHTCTLPMKASGRSSGTYTVKSSSLVDHREKYSSSFRTHSHSTHAGTVRNAKWHPSALKKIILALNTQFFFSPCSGSEFLQDLPGKSDFQLIKFTAHPRQTILPHSLGRHTSVLSLGQHLQTSGESPVSCTMTDTEIHYSTYLYLVVIQRTGFGFQKRKPIYRREA